MRIVVWRFREERDEEQDQFIFAGSVFEAEGQYHIFYTGYNRDYPALGKPSQVLMHAYSDDLVTWHKTQDALTSLHRKAMTRMTGEIHG